MLQSVQNQKNFLILPSLCRHFVDTMRKAPRLRGLPCYYLPYFVRAAPRIGLVIQGRCCPMPSARPAVEPVEVK